MAKKPENEQQQEIVTSLEAGRCYLVESVTSNLYLGRLISIDGPHTLTLEAASWIRFTGRLHLFMREGRAANMEVEPIGITCVHWSRWCPWPHPLLTEPV